MSDIKTMKKLKNLKNLKHYTKLLNKRKGIGPMPQLDGFLTYLMRLVLNIVITIGVKLNGVDQPDLDITQVVVLENILAVD